MEQESAEVQKYGFNSKTKVQETAILCLLLFLSAMSLCVDLMPVSFFANVAKTEKGLSVAESGFIISCYDLARLVIAPLCPAIVSSTTFFVKPWLSFCVLLSFGLDWLPKRPSCMSIAQKSAVIRSSRSRSCRQRHIGFRAA